MKKIITMSLILLSLIFFRGINVYSLTLTPQDLARPYDAFRESVKNYDSNLTLNIIISVILITILLVILVMYIVNKKNTKHNALLHKVYIGMNILLSILLYLIRINHASIISSYIGWSGIQIIQTYTLEKIILGVYIFMIILGLVCWKKKIPKLFSIAITCLNIILIVINIITVKYMTI